MDEPSDPEVDQELSEAFVRVVHEGRRRLHRSWPALLATGLVGGLDVGIGVLALAVVRRDTGSPLLGAVAFTIGFVALTLAGSELFTENFLVPIVSAVARPEIRAIEVVRLCVGTLAANLVAAFGIMAIIVAGLPSLRSEIVTLGRFYPELGLGGTAFASAVLAGMTMTLLTWLEHRAPSTIGRLASAVSAGFVLAAPPLNHAVIGSLEMSGALIAGAPFGYGSAAASVGWAILGNVVGGIGLVTLLRLVQIGRSAVEAEQRRP